MIAQVGAVLRFPVLYLPRRPASFATFRWQSIAPVAPQHRNLAFLLALPASVLAGALVTSAMMDRQEPIIGQEAKIETTLLATVRNETVVYRQARTPHTNADQDYSVPSTEQIEASDQIEDNDAPLNFPRSVQIVPFVNPEMPASFAT
jgi:hypothetical protein